MKQSELFACNEWLSDFNENMSYREIIQRLMEGRIDETDITVWEVVEHDSLDNIAQCIQVTKEQFERVTEPLVLALRDAITLGRSEHRSWDELDNRLNVLRSILAEWE